MGVSLTDFEMGAPFAGDHGVAVAAVQARLEKLQRQQIARGDRTIILLEGWEGSGRKAALKLLGGALDLCHVSVHCPLAPEFDSGRHWLASYWNSLPRTGETSVFFGSWYRNPVHARAAGALGDKEWARAFDEINEFEAQQTDHGTVIVKLFLHVTEQAQSRRLRDRDSLVDPESGAEPARSEPARAALLSAWQDMFARSDTRWAPWRPIDGCDDLAGPLGALTAVADALDKGSAGDASRKERKPVPLVKSFA